jgi:hypothetical protein
MYEAAIRTSCRIGSIYCEDGEFDLARYWCERASVLIHQIGVQRLSCDYLTLQIDLALESGDLASAQRVVDSAMHVCPLYTAPRWSKEYLVYRLRVAQHDSDQPVPQGDLECLLEWHQRAKHLGRHDDNMEVIWTAFWRRGMRAEASSILRDYLCNSRRERRTVNFMLYSRTQEDPIWEELLGQGVGSRHDHRTLIGLALTEPPTAVDSGVRQHAES